MILFVEIGHKTFFKLADVIYAKRSNQRLYDPKDQIRHDIKIRPIFKYLVKRYNTLSGQPLGDGTYLTFSAFLD